MLIKDSEIAPCLADGTVAFLYNSSIGMIELYQRKDSIK